MALKSQPFWGSKWLKVDSQPHSAKKSPKVDCFPLPIWHVFAKIPPSQKFDEESEYGVTFPEKLVESGRKNHLFSKSVSSKFLVSELRKSCSVFERFPNSGRFTKITPIEKSNRIEMGDFQQHWTRTAQAPAAQARRSRASCAAGACAVRAPVSPTEYFLDSSRKNVAGSNTISKIAPNFYKWWPL